MQPILYSIIEKESFGNSLKLFMNVSVFLFRYLMKQEKSWTLSETLTITVKFSSVFFQRENPAQSSTQAPASLP